MPIGGNGHGNRIYDLNAARPSGRHGKPIGLTPDEARVLIDGVFRSYGLDPMKSTGPYGWRHIKALLEAMLALKAAGGEA